MLNILQWAALYSYIIVYEADLLEAAPNSASQTAAGRKFVIFPIPGFQVQPNVSELYINPVGTSAVTVRLKASWLSETFFISRGEVVKMPLPATFRMNATGVYSTAVLLTSDRDVLVRTFHSVSRTETSAVLLHPVQWAGKVYIFPGVKLRFFAVAALKAHTVIRIESIGASASKEEHLQSFEVYLSADTTFQPRLLSASKPVLVYAGYTEIPGPGQPNTLVTNPAVYNDYILPLDRWSSFYILPGEQGTLVITSSSPNVSVTLVYCAHYSLGRNTTTEILQHAGNFTKKPVGVDCPIIVTASAPINVLYSFRLYRKNVVYSVLAVDTYSSTYTFINNSRQSYKMYIVIKKAKLPGIRMLGIQKSYNSYAREEIVSDYGVYKFRMNRGGKVTVYHTQGEKFGLYILGQTSTGLDFWAPADKGFSKQRWFCIDGFPEPRVGDGIDNDCDNRTDEEPSHTTDLDGDGVVGEDVSWPDAVHGGWGQWQAWYCSSKCDVTEIKRRRRACDSPAPSNGGIWCPGIEFELSGHCIGWSDPCLMNCPDGTWGTNCSRTCPENCLLGKCRGRDGICVEHSCKAGYRGDLCDVPCARNTYGPGCFRFCTQRCLYVDCHPVTGKCSHDPVSVKKLMVLVPVYICFPTAVVVFILKFGKIKSYEELLAILQWKSATLVNRHARLLLSTRGSQESDPVGNGHQPENVLEASVVTPSIVVQGAQEIVNRESDTFGTLFESLARHSTARRSETVTSEQTMDLKL
ncbi:hypothetical protein RRG08_009331 [Elysia crispata]|uniref:IgGFc-binding protein N-terminal domain-containing protein n=1 Tax=Elysia crispata TaxID=231223 RepID=A0AAE0Y994_9GAST|nr:hypothetical protein RRG08_009331 [Elysia crispata]